MRNMLSYFVISFFVFHVSPTIAEDVENSFDTAVQNLQNSFQDDDLIKLDIWEPFDIVPLNDYFRTDEYRTYRAALKNSDCHQAFEIAYNSFFVKYPMLASMKSYKRIIRSWRNHFLYSTFSDIGYCISIEKLSNAEAIISKSNLDVDDFSYTHYVEKGITATDDSVKMRDKAFADLVRLMGANHIGAARALFQRAQPGGNLDLPSISKLCLIYYFRAKSVEFSDLPEREQALRVRISKSNLRALDEFDFKWPDFSPILCVD